MRVAANAELIRCCLSGHEFLMIEFRKFSLDHIATAKKCVANKVSDPVPHHLLVACSTSQVWTVGLNREPLSEPFGIPEVLFEAAVAGMAVV
jgi:hypothetical protein